MAEQNQIPENLPIGGSDVPSVKIQAPKEGLEGLKEVLSSVFSKGDKAARATLGPAAAPAEGLLSLFDLRNVPAALSSAGKDLQSGVTEGDPKALAAGILGTALVGAENVPGGRAASKVASSFAKPLEVGIDETLSSGKILKNYNEQDFNILEDLVNQGKASAGTKAANKLINAPINQGKEVGIRLNLNSKINDAPENVKPMLQTIHNKNARGSALSYQPFATVVGTKNKKVQFYVSPTGREQIAKGEKSKFPAMSVNGAYEPNLKILPTDDDVVEIGFNPKAHHLFIDLKTGQAVKEADAATVIGDRVYAKNVSYFKKSEAPIPEADSQVRYKYKKKGGSVVERNPYNYTAKAI